MARLPLLTFAELAASGREAPCRLTTVWETGAFAIAASPKLSGGAAPPFGAIRRLFDRADAALAVRRSTVHHAVKRAAVDSGPKPPEAPARFWRGLICREGRERLHPAGVDRKRSIDLTTEALSSRRLSRRLGGDLLEVQSFFAAQEDGEDCLVATLARSLHHAFGLSHTILTGHRLHRLLDYREELADLPGPRCHPHLDRGSFTLLWEDSPGLQVLRPCGDWADWPAGAAVVVVAGSAASFLTGGRVLAPPHRVLAPEPHRDARLTPRRTAIAYFVEPAKSQVLVPASRPGDEGPLPRLTYGELKRKAQHQGGHVGASCKMGSADGAA
mmetsp:Transcript_91586/g.286604  ORF Transcript_91586/g.286604 Transcript_91586/m.286604 type:complete len:329 (+) Transcript_91586:46-1032(+)